MRHPGLDEKLLTSSYELRFTRLGMPLLLMLFPLLVFAGVTQYAVGYVSPVAAGAALATYALVLWLGAAVVRRELRETLRRDAKEAPPYAPRRP